MGNHKVREFTKRHALDEAWKRAKNVARDLHEDVSIPAIGRRSAQILCRPSFERGYAWDVRESGNVCRLYRSKIVEEGLNFKLSGYEEIQADDKTLKLFLDRMRALALPIAPDFSGRGGLDGTSYQLSLAGDMTSEICFRWWEKGPSQWQALTSIVNEMIQVFRSLSPIEEPI